MKIGELASQTGTAVETIRFYEREGLLPEPERTAGNYRVYTAAHVERLAFVRHCRNLDMTLDEIRVLLRYKDAPEDNCGEVNALLDQHIGHVAQRIRELRSLEKALKDLRQQCNQGQQARDCGILNELTQAANQAPSSRSHRSSHVKGCH
ncbi:MULTISPECIES: Cd(II)/Pb(II)-responsive transcriptional regulator [Azohydromonas]|uniref:Cd(II)/Pb(II)-responsive transcriptional regulator n=1 Tax=Azohydromonas lata TaxID=45677 RepID=A0ABU5I9W4_9BURK|nr:MULTISPECIES: Cd(II)/Pb(II)-responsive transcriptional regulator [Azohydromonas]MDZ5455707.1 Cd(II)/Pb(II)-responsive transcriptional regulator [Azohydromonas lata]